VNAHDHHARDFEDAAHTRLSFVDRLYAWRDALIGNPLFQRLSASFPLTRPIAHRQARGLFDLCAGFVYSQVLSACVDLDICHRVRQFPKTAQQLAAETGLPADAMERLLRAAASLRLLSKRSGGRYGLGMLGAALAADRGIVAMIEHHKMLYRDLARPVDLLRGTAGETELARFWRYASSNLPLSGSDISGYSALMAQSQSFIAGDVLDAYPFARHRCLMDVGGGEGAFLRAAAARYPHLNMKLYDLPAVAARAKKLLREDLQERMTVHGGSFIDAPLPSGADLISLVRIVHDHDDGVVRLLLKRVHAALPEGGRILIAEPMAGVPGAEAVGDAYFGFYLLAMGTGRARSADELCAMLSEAGFRAPRRLRTRRPMLVGAVTAEK
jgi:demethylspheroidene O-methyltransferase